MIRPYMPAGYGLVIRAILANVLIAAFVSLACAAGGEGNSIRVKVSDIKGKPAAGAELWLERIDAKGKKWKSLSDSSGQFTFHNVAPGSYKISAYDYKTPAAAATTVRSTANGSAAVTLSLGKMSGSVSKTGKTKKRYVWVAAETGSHIGGGKWVPVDEDVNGTGANAVEKRSGAMLTQPQTDGLRAWQGLSH